MRSYLLILMLGLVACNGSSEKSKKAEKKIYSLDVNSTGNEEITCWGIGEIDLDNDLQTLGEKVDRKDISVDSVITNGVFDRFVTKLWKGTPKEVIVYWKEKTPPFQAIEYLEITQPKSPYHFVNGIKIGTSLKEIVKLNGGKPLSLTESGEPLKEIFTSFGQGKLSGDIPCFGGVFATPGGTGKREAKAMISTKKILSSNPALANKDLRLISIQIHP